MPAVGIAWACDASSRGAWLLLAIPLAPDLQRPLLRRGLALTYVFKGARWHQFNNFFPTPASATRYWPPGLSQFFAWLRCTVLARLHPSTPAPT